MAARQERIRFSKMKGYGYILSTVVVFGAFVATVIFPAFFMG